MVIDRFDPCEPERGSTAAPGDLCMRCVIKRNAARFDDRSPDVYVEAIKVCVSYCWMGDLGVCYRSLQDGCEV